MEFHQLRIRLVWQMISFRMAYSSVRIQRHL